MIFITVREIQANRRELHLLLCHAKVRRKSTKLANKSGDNIERSVSTTSFRQLLFSYALAIHLSRCPFPFTRQQHTMTRLNSACNYVPNPFVGCSKSDV